MEQQLLSVLTRKQDEIIRVQKDIEVLKDWIRAQDARDGAVTQLANEAEIRILAKRAERGAGGSSLLGVFLVGCCLTAMLLLGIWTHSATQETPGATIVSIQE